MNKELLSVFNLRLSVIKRCPICGAYTNGVEVGLGTRHPLPMRFICHQAEISWHHIIYQLLTLHCQTNDLKEKKFLQKSILRAWRQRKKDGIHDNVMYVGLARNLGILY